MVIAILQEWDVVNEIDEGYMGTVKNRWPEIVSPTNIRIRDVIEIGATAIACSGVDCFGICVAELQLQFMLYV